MITKEEFIEGHYLASKDMIGYENITKTPEGVQIAGTDYVALPCACDYPACEGWGMVQNDPLSIELHNKYYAPKED